MNEIKLQPLDRKLGIISMIFSIELIGNSLEMYALTLDDRYLMLRFENPVAGYVFSDDL